MKAGIWLWAADCRDRDPYGLAWHKDTYYFSVTCLVYTTYSTVPIQCLDITAGMPSRDNPDPNIC